MKLNTEQNVAVSHNEGPMLVLAGPGSGKTMVIVHRVQHLVKHCNVMPQQILVVTFTKAAATHMAERFQQLDRDGKQVTFSTFHSLFFRILRRHYRYQLNSIISEELKWKAMRECVRAEGVETEDEEEYIKDFFSQLSIMKNELAEEETFQPKGIPPKEFRSLMHQYEQMKEEQGLLDFDDLLVQCHHLLANNGSVLSFWRNQYPYIMVDEYQDINQAQFLCLQMLSGGKNNLFVVGDDDQSIYRFRGARPEYLLDFPALFPGLQSVTLQTNYRSSDPIIRLSEKVISRNEKRFAKHMTGTGAKGDGIQFFSAVDVYQEASEVAVLIQKRRELGMSYRDIAVIFRTNLQMGIFARTFMDSGIPYQLADSIANIFEHWIAADLLAYLELALDNSRNQDFVRIINKPKRYISKEMIKEVSTKEGTYIEKIFTLRSLQVWQSKYLQTLQKHLEQIGKRKPEEAISYIRKVVGYDDYIMEYSQYRHSNGTALKGIADELQQSVHHLNELQEVSPYIMDMKQKMQAAKKESSHTTDEAVVLSTMHSAKGLEFDSVFLPSLVEGVAPHEKAVTPEDVEEERRLFYVGVTRAKNYLCLSELRTRFEKDTERSRFLVEIGLQNRKIEKGKQNETKSTK